MTLIEAAEMADRLTRPSDAREMFRLKASVGFQIGRHHAEEKITVSRHYSTIDLSLTLMSIERQCAPIPFIG
jgi:hypothetical protein